MTDWIWKDKPMNDFRTPELSGRMNAVECPRCYKIVTESCGPNCAWDWVETGEDELKRLRETLLHKVESALRELVACKDLKEAITSDPSEERTPEFEAMVAEYNRRKPLAWKAARAAIASLRESPTEGENA